MDSVGRSFNYELPNDLHFDKYAQQILESGKTIGSATADVSTPTISTIDATVAASASSDFLQKLGATLLNSIQLQHNQQLQQLPDSMDMEFTPNHVIIDSSSFDAIEDLQKQMDYDKFMNEVWIGIVLTLILISMVFCICSCFLYHQFRTWKQSYRGTVAQAQTFDIEAAKLHPDLEDPVPEYTLVSGLPTYDAALELMRQTPQSCLIVHPSVFSVFNCNERAANVSPGIHIATSTTTTTAEKQQTQQIQQQLMVEVTTPLLSLETRGGGACALTATNAAATDASAAEFDGGASKTLRSYQQNALATPSTITNTTFAFEKAPSYEEALFGRKQEKR